ncbi:family S53 protease-like protein [Mycena metata]|uniref:tripeptidyl-peptidase II n=1 Tax=Mycena metata TaxID=1033252 RepID=A0AAD7H6C1_9AGAR|nr:family S53 protease-like protein [Mycena metata]
MVFPKFQLLTFLSIAGVASAGGMVLHEWLTAPPAGFTSQGAAPASEMLTLRIGLTSNNINGLQDHLLSVSTPGSTDFRQWLSADEVKSYVQPSPVTTETFNSFASANGFQPKIVSPSGDWLSITLSVSQANKLFAANFEHFTHPNMTAPFTRTLSLSLPEELVGHVDVVHPTTAFDTPRPRLGVSGAARSRHSRRAIPPDSCLDPTDSITPSCLQTLYGIPVTPATQPSNTFLVTGYAESWPQTAALELFLQTYRPDIPSNITFTLESLDGGVDTQGQFFFFNVLEANLDTQYTIGLATGVPVTFLSVGNDTTETEFFTSLLDTTILLASAPNPPSTMTTSYGDNEINFGSTLATKICDGYMQMAARGISVLFASGDGGVRGSHDVPIQCTNDTFIPTFPASCSWVTSVGATVNFAPETAEAFSSGGFSDVFPMPAYQSASVAAYLATLPSDFPGKFNASGRGFPDVSFQGSPYAVMVQDVVTPIEGTSCSSPGFASVIALINDRLVAENKPTLGFLNPWLYGTVASSGALTDVTVGHNSGDECADPMYSGFDAAVGWDPLTGLGTPIFVKLLAAALA